MLEHVNKEQVRVRNNSNPVLGGQRHGAAHVSGHDANGAVQAHGKVVVLHGLDHKVKRVHGVAAHRVLGQVGHKDERRLLVVPAHDLRSLHAVDAGHVYVHEHEVSRSPGVDELQRAAQDLNVELKALLGCVAPEEVLQDLRLRWRVLNYQDLEHSRPDSVRLRYRFCHRRPSRAT